MQYPTFSLPSKLEIRKQPRSEPITAGLHPTSLVFGSSPRGPARSELLIRIGPLFV
ncbi:unnamed protein product [Nesidiocoris tenuis]|uniref:Uncharacterized protein n=1 Tax=Nesidiocoris tenuis TaxID=355587 RepID=A0A6H5GCX0_9HEMI|nr:unnamed protein product [Nesidiocoris tenuis]